jgi:hypothetical protein
VLLRSLVQVSRRPRSWLGKVPRAGRGSSRKKPVVRGICVYGEPRRKSTADSDLDAKLRLGMRRIEGTVYPGSIGREDRRLTESQNTNFITMEVRVWGNNDNVCPTE